MGTSTSDGRAVEGGPAQPVYVLNSASDPVQTSGGGGGGGAVTIADGADVAQGATSDAATANTVIGRLKKLISLIPAALGQTTAANSLAVVPASDYQQPIVPANATPAVTSVAANNADMVASMDVSKYRSGSFFLTGFGSAAVQIQTSNDGTNWQALVARTGAGAGITNLTIAGQFFFSLPPTAFLRIRTTSWSSGTLTGSLFLSSIPFSDHTVELTSNNGATNATVGVLNADAFSATNALWVNSFLGLFNGSTIDRQRNNNALTLISSAARTADLSSGDQINYNWRGLAIFLNVSAQAGGSVKMTLQYKDSISRNYFTVWSATAAVTTTGQFAYLLYPGALDAASWTEKAQFALAARTWRLTTTTANGSSITYSVSADMLL